MDIKNLKLNDNIYLDVAGTVKAEFSTQISYEWIIDTICDSQPKHVGEYLIASIEHDTIAEAEGKYNMNQVRKAIEGTMIVHGIYMDNLIKEHPISSEKSYEKMTIKDIQSMGVVTNTPRK